MEEGAGESVRQPGLGTSVLFRAPAQAPNLTFRSLSLSSRSSAIEAAYSSIFVSTTVGLPCGPDFGLSSCQREAKPATLPLKR